MKFFVQVPLIYVMIVLGGILFNGCRPSDTSGQEKMPLKQDSNKEDVFAERGLNNKDSLLEYNRNKENVSSERMSNKKDILSKNISNKEKIPSDHTSNRNNASSKDTSRKNKIISLMENKV